MCFEFFKQDQNNIDSKGRLFYEFEKTRVGTIKQNIKVIGIVLTIIPLLVWIPMMAMIPMMGV
ncbi:MAG: hypothetical protein OEL77_05790 [Nitrosopumilus sp.]|nr:hypothetical protein [Nitrosopumilus sp.]MDH3385506.1 hypothetical protein [Nitrosopumilus sp.]